MIDRRSLRSEVSDEYREMQIVVKDYNRNICIENMVQESCVDEHQKRVTIGHDRGTVVP